VPLTAGELRGGLAIDSRPHVGSRGDKPLDTVQTSRFGSGHEWFTKIGVNFDERGKAVETRGGMAFDAKTKSMRDMSLDQMGDLADSLVDAEAEGRTLRDIIAPPPDRSALRLLVSEFLRRRAAGEDTADLEAHLPSDGLPQPAPRHDWHFRGSASQRLPLGLIGRPYGSGGPARSAA
jgi:hypothetical protein